VLKKNSPVLHVAGRLEPLLAGFVAAAPDASQLPCMVLLPVTVVWATAVKAVSAEITINFFIDVIFFYKPQNFWIKAAKSY
jgi:hypothetical protein